MTRLTRPSRALVATFVATSILLAACGGGGGEEDSTSAAPEPEATTTSIPDGDGPTTTQATTPAADFCEVAAVMLVARPRPYIGSAEHVADLERVRDAAEGDLVDDLDVLVDHYANDVDPAVPDSQDFVNFPAAVQEVALRVQQQLSDAC